MRCNKSLFVEDEPAIREMVEMSLTRAGYHVTGVQDSRTAVMQIADRYPDLILLDWMLPDSSGLELARQIRKDKQTRHKKFFHSVFAPMPLRVREIFSFMDGHSSCASC